MKPSAILLACLIAGQALGDSDGGLYGSCSEPTEVAEQRDGGVWLPQPRAAYDACKLASCDAFAQTVMDAGTPNSTSTLLVVTAVVSALSALSSAYIQNRTARHLPILP